MYYILLDLEWDCFYSKQQNGFVNEILQFGAVKLDQNFKQIDRFSVNVRSALSKKLSGRFKRLTCMNNEQMLAGLPLKEALNQYKNWAGQEGITLSWSNTDLHVLYKNCEIFLHDTSLAKLGNYADLQKIFHGYIAGIGKPEKDQMSLSHAAEFLGIGYAEENLHTAVDDSDLAAKILKKCYDANTFENYVHNTNDDRYYHAMMYKPHHLKTLDDPLIDFSKFNLLCDKCGSPLQLIGKWQYKNNWFRATLYCKKCHKKKLGGVSLKRYYDKISYRQRFFSPKPKQKPEKTAPQDKKNDNGNRTLTAMNSGE